MTEQAGYVQVEETAPHVSTVTFFHPAHNAMPSHLLAALAQAINTLGQDPAVRIIVLKSGGDRTFCAGASFDELLQINDAGSGEAFFSGFADVINACRRCPKLIIGRVQGKAIGGGVGLAAATDYCVATKYAAVKLSELAIGIGPFVVGPVIERKIGLAAFSHLTLAPTTFASPVWAREKGLFNEVFETAEAMDEAIQVKAAQMATYNPAALEAMKRAFWHGTDHWDILLAERARTSGELVLSDFTRSALEAFKEGSRS
ncbi:MAG: enoyl-CoA hydratase/isomerase family protein [Bacteroidota bacterium]